MKRLFFDIFLILSVFLLPWWFTLVLGILGLFLFNHFYEFIGASVALYALYAFPSERLIASPLWFALIVSAIYIAIQTLHRYLILYKS